MLNTKRILEPFQIHALMAHHWSKQDTLSIEFTKGFIRKERNYLLTLWILGSVTTYLRLVGTENESIFGEAALRPRCQDEKQGQVGASQLDLGMVATSAFYGLHRYRSWDFKAWHVFGKSWQIHAVDKFLRRSFVEYLDQYDLGRIREIIWEDNTVWQQRMVRVEALRQHKPNNGL
jgi:hypothetical protein